jgi:hypothetical protein
MEVTWGMLGAIWMLGAWGRTALNVAVTVGLGDTPDALNVMTQE